MPAERGLKIAADLINGKTASALAFILEDPARSFVNGSWENVVTKLVHLADQLASRTTIAQPAFSVFATEGNVKLPFAAFSSMAILDCAGFGECGKWCYSKQAWRHPNAWGRQVANSMLLRHESGRQLIAAEFAKLKVAKVAIPDRLTVVPREQLAWYELRELKKLEKLAASTPQLTLRLYVDGDFHSKECLEFWMDLIKSRPEVRVYGYSKSWVEFVSLHLSGYAWPENYILNLSSGSRHDDTLREIMATLPVTRGEFIAVQVDRRHMASKAYQSKRNDGHAEYAKDVRQSAGKRVFVCPGRCGDCMPDGSHACGSPRMNGVTIAIGVH
jgi:hypothetical protein